MYAQEKISQAIALFDQLRLKIFYNPILKHFGYPIFSFEEHPLPDRMVRDLFRYPFRMEAVIEEKSHGAVTRAQTHQWIQQALLGYWKKDIISAETIPLEEIPDE